MQNKMPDMTRNTLAVPEVHRTYKARLFAMIFSDRKELLSLYNAVNGTEYTDPDAFSVSEEDYALELKALLLNINKGHNVRLLETCKTLGDYAEYTARVRTYTRTMGLKEAVERAVEECIKNDVLPDFCMLVSEYKTP